MSDNEDDIFSDKFEKKKPKEEPKAEAKVVEEPEEKVEEPAPPPPPPKETKTEDWGEPEPPDKPIKSSKKKAGIIGAIIIGLAIGGIAFGAQQLMEPFDASQCQYGVHSDFLGNRCVTQEEYDAIQERQQESTIVEKPSGGGTKDVSSTSDKVELQKTKEILGQFWITSNGDWYGDYVDFREIPSKIEKSGNMTINFRCYTDEFIGASTYFGTFRNVVDDYLRVDVYLNGKHVDSEVTFTNRAIILEGDCLQ